MEFQRILLKWFRKNQRPLPWRKRYRPYEVWVSEIMLQQTQVATVLPYYRRWLRSFPTVKALAAAPQEKVLKHWQGLGYYSRARNIHAAAREIVDKHGGIFPDKFNQILALKGVGRYTAGAIASIAFNQEKPIVDGNVLRVLSRIYHIRKPIDYPENREYFWKLQERLIPKGQARFFNQALMELGALVCSARNPLCTACPVQNFCGARRQKDAEAYPVRGKRKKTVKVEAASLIVSRNGKFLLQKRPLGKIMGGLWEFPEWKLSKKGTIPAETIRKKIQMLGRRRFGVRLDAKPLCRLKRNYTHHAETMHVFLSVIKKSSRQLKSVHEWPVVWASPREFEKYPFSSVHARIAERLTD